MNLIDAFLTISGLAYFWFLHFQATTTIKKELEKILFFSFGVLILFSVHVYSHWLLSLLMSIIFVVAAVDSWIGVQIWKVRGVKDRSQIHQVAMCAWDLLIALCFMLKV